MRGVTGKNIVYERMFVPGELKKHSRIVSTNPELSGKN
jgi:hypothetical protein